MSRKRSGFRRFLGALVLGGTCFQFGCDPLAAIGRGLNDFNPCLTILACDPQVYAFASSGIEGGGVTEADPFCTFPPFCTAAQDPIFGGIGP
jgi:hypothetical protein